MKNILTRVSIILSITNFCNGQITPNLSFGIDELLNNPYEYNGKSICLITNSGAINKDGLTSVEVLHHKDFDLQLVIHLDNKDHIDANKVQKLDADYDVEEIYAFNLSNKEIVDKIKDIDFVFIDF